MNTSSHHEELDLAGGENSPLHYVRTVLEVLKAIAMLLWLILVGAFKACLPPGFLPRKSVANEIVLITGSGSGLGRMMALRFSRLGARVVLLDVNEKANEETAKMVQDINGQAYAYKCDLSDREAIYRVAEQVKKEVGEVDILINNAGVVTGRAFDECPDELIMRTMNVNTNAHFWTTKSFLPGMLSRNHGHLVYVASAAGLFPCTRMADYCASKFGAVGFGESLAIELDTMEKNVNVTMVCPYFINTGMFEGVTTRFPCLLPILEPEYVVDRIMDSVLTNQKLLIMPRILYALAWLNGWIPVDAGFYLGHLTGVTHSMDEFKGRH